MYDFSFSAPNYSYTSNFSFGTEITSFYYVLSPNVNSFNVIWADPNSSFDNGFLYAATASGTLSIIDLKNNYEYHMYSNSGTAPELLFADIVDVNVG